jgi:hypothetical protein
MNSFKKQKNQEQGQVQKTRTSSNLKPETIISLQSQFSVAEKISVISVPKSMKQKNNHIRHISLFNLDCVEKFIKVFLLAKTLSRKDEELCVALCETLLDFVLQSIFISLRQAQSDNRVNPIPI